MATRRWYWSSAAKKANPAAPKLSLQRLEDRSTPAVTASLLAGGVLDVRLDANDDAATISSDGTTLTVTGPAVPFTTPAAGVAALTAASPSGVRQLVTFSGSISLANALTVSGIDKVTFSSAKLAVGSASVNADGPITLATSTLAGTGPVTLASAITAGSVGTPLLGASVGAAAGVTVTDSTVSGSAVTISAGVVVTASAAGDTAEDTNRDFARVAVNATAAVMIEGGSKITSPGPITITANTSLTTTATASAKTTSTNPNVDAAVAFQNLTTAATVDLKGTTSVTAGGTLTVAAKNNTTATTTADGSSGGAAAIGASVARARLDAVTFAILAGQGTFTAADVDVSAVGTSNLVTTAKSANGGASGNDADTKQALIDDGAKSSEGQLGLTAAFASNVLARHETLASINTSGAVTATNAVRISAGGTADATSTADGSVTGSSGAGTPVGIGGAVAIARGLATTRASLSSLAPVTGKTVLVEAVAPASSDFLVTAKSGAGAKNVGIAGAFALDAVSVFGEAVVPGTANVSVGGADLTLAATTLTTNTVSATPVVNASKVGVGAAVALNNTVHTTRARVEAGATVAGADDLTLTANGNHTTNVTAQIGGEGGVAVTPGVAIAIAKNDTTVQLAQGPGTGAATPATGAVTLTATHAGSTTATASGKAAGAKVAVGAALGLVEATDEAAATVLRPLTAGGAVTITATNAATSKADGIAGATGSTATGTADGQIDGVTTSATPPAETSSGKLGAAAALGLNLTTGRATALVGHTLTAGGVVTIDAKNTVTAGSKGDGSAVVPGSVGVGIGFGLTAATADTAARLDPGAKITAAGLTVRAATGIGHTFTAEAVAGAGGKTVGVAGSLAINKVTNVTSATFEPLSTASGTGAVVVSADGKSTATTTAAASASGSSLGFGAAVARTAAANVVVAEIEDGARLLAAGSLAVTANAAPTTKTAATGGAESLGEEGTAAITPFIAAGNAANATFARVGSGSGGANVTAGAATVEATHTASSVTTADGSALGNQVGLGLGLALNVATDAVTAKARSLTAGGAVTIRATSAAATSAAATASARGGPAADTTPVDNQISVETSQTDLLSGTTTSNSVGAKAPDGANPTGDDKGVAFAAAVGVNNVRATARAGIEDGGTVTAGGLVVVSAGQNADTTAKGDGSAVQGITPPPQGVGSAVGVAINNATLTEEATVGAAVVNARGLTVETFTKSLTGDAVSTSLAASNSGAGAKVLGVAGSFAIDKVAHVTTAAVKTGAVVTAGIGASTDDVTITAGGTVADSATATAKLPVVTDSVKVGVGGSFAIGVISTDTRAAVESGAAITGANDLTAAATRTSTRTVTTEAGASGGVAISPAMAVLVAGGVTTAAAESGPLLTITGNFTASTNHTATATTKADADAGGKTVAVGTLLALATTDDASRATLARDVTAGGGVSILVSADSDSTTTARASAVGGSTKLNSDTAGDRLRTYGRQFKDTFASDQSIGERLRAELGKGQAEAKKLADTQADGIGVAGGFGVNVSRLDAAAVLAAGAKVTAGGVVAITSAADADSSMDVRGVAGGANTATAVGMAVAANIATLTNAATLGANAIVSGAGVTVTAGPKANDSRQLVAKAIGGGGAKTTGVAGSVALTIAVDTTAATIGNGAKVASSKALTVTADANTKLQTLSGSGAVGFEGVAVGAAVAVNVLTPTTTASVGSNATTDAALATLVRATGTTAGVDGIPGSPVSGAVGGSFSANFGFAGSAAVNVVNEKVTATLGIGAKVNQTGAVGTASQTVEVRATSTDTLNSAAGVGQVSTAAGSFGPGADVTVFNRTTAATVGTSALVRAGGAVTVASGATEKVTSVAASIGGSATVLVAGATSVYVPTTTTRAAVDPSATIDAGGNASVTATHTTNATTGVGAAGFGADGAVGGAFSVIVANDTVDAAIGAGVNVVTRGATGLTVEAIQTGDVRPVAVGGLGAGGIGVAGSASIAHLTSAVTAHVNAGATVTAQNATTGFDPGVRVAAKDTTTLIGIAGAAVIGTDGGVGAGADAHRVKKATQAWIAGNTVVLADRDVVVAADSKEDVTSVAGSASAGGSSVIVGSAAVVVLDVTTRAVLGADPTIITQPVTPASVTANGNVIVAADDKTEVDAVAGGAALAVGGGVAVGGAAAVPVVVKTTEAYIAAGASVQANGQAAAAVVRTGGFTVGAVANGTAANEVRVPGMKANDADGDGVNDLADASLTTQRTATLQSSPLKGVAVTATDATDVESIAVGAGLSVGSVAVELTAPVSSVTATTRAFIGAGANVNATNSGASAEQDVRVAAGADLYFLGIGGAGGGAAAVAVGAAGAVTLLDTATEAFIGKGATVAAARDVTVVADATEDALVIAAGAAGSPGVAVVGSATVLDVDAITDGYIGSGATVTAGDTVSVLANDATDADLVAGALTVGITTGVGAAVGVITVKKVTQAFIDDSAAVTGSAAGTRPELLTRGVIVAADTSEDVKNFATAGAGGFVGVAGGVSVTVVDSDTSARIDPAAKVTAGGAGSVGVTADNAAVILSVGGGLAGGVVALGGGVDAGSLRNDTRAVIDTSAVVNSAKAVTVTADAFKDVRSVAVSGAGGLVGLNASVAVWGIGTATNDTYSNEGNGGTVSTRSALDDGSGTGADRNADDFAGQQASKSGTRVTGNLTQFEGADALLTGDLTPAQRLGQAVRLAGLGLNVPSHSVIVTDLNSTAAQPGTQALIATGASVTAGTDVTVAATETMDVDVFAGGVSAGVVAVGASVAVLNVKSTTDARINGIVAAGGDVAVEAELVSQTADAKSLAGRAGLVALGAAVAVIRDTSTQVAQLGTTGDIRAADAVAVTARGNQTLRPVTSSVSGGGIQAGASFTVATSDGGTTAALDFGAKVGQTAGQSVGAMSVVADSNVVLDSDTASGAGGVVASIDVNFSRSEATRDVSALLRSGSAAKVSGDLAVSAIADGRAVAESLGVNLAGGIAAGASRATAKNNPVVLAQVSNATIVAGNDIALASLADGVQAVANAFGTTAAILLGAGGAIANAESLPSVTTNVNSGVESKTSLAAGHDIVLTSRGSAYVQGIGDNFAAGLFAPGTGQGTATADAVTTTSLTGDGFVHLAAGGDVVLESTGSLQSNADGRSFGVAIRPGSSAVATATTDYDTRVVTSPDSLIEAGNRVTLRARQDLAQANGDARADGRGIGGGSDADAVVRVGRGGNDPALVEALHQGVIVAPLVDMFGTATSVLADGDADAVDSGASVNGNTNAFARGDVVTTARVRLALDSTTEATTKLTMASRHDAVSNRADSFADDFLGTVGTAADSRANQITDSLVVADFGAGVKARAIDVDAITTPTLILADAIRDAIGGDGSEPGTEFTNLDPERRITWAAHTTILAAPDPELIISSTGTITKGIGAKATVTTFNGRPAVVVEPIAFPVATNPVNFFANTITAFGNADPSIVDGSGGRFVFDRTPENITVVNNSANDLVVGSVNAIGTGTPQIDIFAGSVPLSFFVEHDYDPTNIVIQNGLGGLDLSNPLLVLTGAINNPIGTTTIANARGDIRTASGQLIETKSLDVTATGSVGEAANRLRTNVIRSAAGNSTVSVDAFTDAFVQFGLRQRQSLGFFGTTATVPLTDLAAGRDLNVQLNAGLLQLSQPDTLPPSQVLETFPAPDKLSVLNNFFRPQPEEFPLLPPLGVFGTGTDPVPTRFNFTSATAGRNLAINGTSSTVNRPFVGGTPTLGGDGDMTVSGVTGSGATLTGGPGANDFVLTNTDGTLTVNGAAGDDTLTTTTAAGTVTTAEPMTFVGGSNAFAAPLTLAGPLHLPLAATVSANNTSASDDFTLAGTLTGTGDLTKPGEGTLTISGSSPAYTGSVRPQAGLTLFDGSTPASIARPSGGDIGGTGTVGGVSADAATVAANVSPGTENAAGKLAVDGSLVLNGGTTFRVQIVGTTVGTFDTTTVSSKSILGNAPLAVSTPLGFAPTLGTKFVVINNTSTAGVSGTFAGVPEGALVTSTGGKLTFAVSYVGGDGNDVVLTRANSASAFGDRTITAADENGIVAVGGTIIEADPEDSFQLDVNWGDGASDTYTFPAGSGGQRIEVTHQYLDNAPGGAAYPVRMSWTDPQGGGKAVTLDAAVANVAPTLAPDVLGTVAVRTPVTLRANAADISPVDVLSVNWVVTDATGGEVARGTGAEFAFTPTKPGTYTAAATVADDDGGTATRTVNVVVPVVAPRKIVATAAGDGQTVRVIDAATNEEVMTLSPFAGFRGGVRVATADLTGDGVTDVVTAAGPGGGPHVMAFDGATGEVIASFFAYDASFTGGVNVAAGDLDGDGRAEIITGTGAGGGPHVQAFDAAGNVVRGFFAYDGRFRGGVTVAAADTDGDGRAEIITGAGAGGGPHVRGFDGVTLADEFGVMAYDPAFTGGVNVAAGDLDGDGVAEVVTGAGPGGGPHVRAFDGRTAAERFGFLADAGGFTGGTRVAVADADGDGFADIVAATGRGGVTAFSGRTGATIGGLTAADPDFLGGVFVG